MVPTIFEASFHTFFIASKSTRLSFLDYKTKIMELDINSFFFNTLSMPNNSYVQQSALSAIGSQVRKSIMSITSSIVRCTADLLSAARSLPIHNSLPIICKSHVVSYLLPFVIAHISVMVESDPKVSDIH